MFQVAARPVPQSFPSMSSVPDDHPVFASSSSLVYLPRTLSRPAFSDISRDVLASIDPELRDVPVEYLKQAISQQTTEMLGAISSISTLVPASLPRSRMPPAFNITLPSSATPTCPTHVIAVASQHPAQSQHQQITLVPTHHIILAAYFARLPQFPRSAPGSNTNPNVTLPVVPLTVPDSTTFPLLHSYLYTARIDVLLASLIPLPPHFDSVALSAASIDAARRAAQYLASSVMHSPDHLMRYAGAINGLWKNVCALGVFEQEVWAALDLAWEILLGAMEIVKARR